MTIHPIFQDASVPWAIDMDGTLIREDVSDLALLTCVMNPLNWSAFIYSLFLWVARGMVHGARYLEAKFPPDPKKLTYNDQLIKHIEAYRKLGGHVILATASHHVAAQPVAKHVDLFENVIASNPPTVMDACAEEKARLLNEQFPDGFVYAGNSEDDLKVWGHDGCKAMMLVNCKPKVLESAQRIGKPCTVIL